MKLNIYVKDDLGQRMSAARDEHDINWSAIAQQAFKAELGRLAGLNNEMEMPDEISKTISELRQIEHKIAEAEAAVSIAKKVALAESDGKAADVRRIEVEAYAAEAIERLRKIEAEQRHLQRWLDYLMAQAAA